MKIKKILVIDDDDNIREIARMSLEDDFDVVVASSGRQGIDLADKESPDVILLDRMMPEMDGVMTLNGLRVHQKLRHTPVIFLTAKVQSHEMEFYSQFSISGVIAKPFDPMTLAAEIRSLVQHSALDTREA